LNVIELTLPWPPSVNHYWKHVPINKFAVKAYIGEKGKAFRQAVSVVVKESGLAVQSGALAIKVIIYCPDWRKRDIDNLNKAVLDSLTHAGAIQGDEFICAAILEKRKSADKEGRVVVQIKRLESGAIEKDSGAWLE
jgi:crossover junction endodeoxyribonuclease RusA